MMIKVGIVGGSGYGAIELIRLLQTHPHVTIAHIYSHSKVDEPLKLTFPHLQHHYPYISGIRFFLLPCSKQQLNRISCR